MLHRRTAREWTLIGLIWLMLLGWALIAGGCGPGGILNVTPDQPMDQWSPKKIASYGWMIYNSNWEDYTSKIDQHNRGVIKLSDDQKDILRKKKEVLNKMWEPLKTFTWYVDNNQVPPETAQETLLDLITMLENLTS